MSMASIRKIKECGNEQFLRDIKTVTDVMVQASETYAYFSITKKEAMWEAEISKIKYKMIDTIFVRKRMAMVIY